jgi:hypothetical protein
VLDVEGVHRVGKRRGEEAARSQVGARTPEKRIAAGRSPEQLQRLHRNDDQRELTVESKVTGVRHCRGDGETLAAPRQGGEQRRTGVEGNHLDTAGGELEGHPASTGADVEQRAARAIGEPTPQRKILRVAAAFQVMPYGV